MFIGDTEPESIWRTLSKRVAGGAHLTGLMWLFRHTMAPFEVAGSGDERDMTGRGQQLPAEPHPAFLSGQKLPQKPRIKGWSGIYGLGERNPESFYF